VIDIAQAWHALRQVPDPEIPVLSITDLGIVREVRANGGAIDVVVTPTYSGCPATAEIHRSIEEALLKAGATRVRIDVRLAPAWTTDWITEEAKVRLRAYGVAAPVRFMPRALECPRCASRDTERLSEFGATPCKAIWRCRACREPFEYFKPL